MIVPPINYQELQRMLELAEDLIIPYKHELENQQRELDYSIKELAAAQSLSNLWSRNEIRNNVLASHSCYLNFYCATLAVGEAEKCETILSLLKYRVESFTAKVNLLNEAITLLTQDIFDIKQIIETRINPNGLIYAAVINKDPGWAINMYHPQNWLARWTYTSTDSKLV